MYRLDFNCRELAISSSEEAMEGDKYCRIWVRSVWTDMTSRVGD